MYLPSEPVGKFVIDLHLEELRTLFNRVITKASRIKLLLGMVDFPIQRTQVIFLSFKIADALRVYGVLCITSMQVVARQQ